VPIKEFDVQGQDVRLNVLEIGSPEGLPVVCIHGLRDSAHALTPIFEGAWQTPPYRVLLPELRGHGTSGPTSAYAMSNFILDVFDVLDQAGVNEVALFGHSLGGHIVTKLAAMWPERVRALIIVEGLGPPTRPQEGDERLEVQAYRRMLEQRAQIRIPKPMPDLAEAARRLKRNNPRLDPAEAMRLAPHLTRNAPEGRGLIWAFDTRAASVFVGNSHRENQKFWRQVQAPTCIISGDLAYEYWGREMSAESYTGKFAEGELMSRIHQFKHQEHHEFDQSGHMVHYDEPERLGQTIKAFLEKHYV
jgi:pimeloyl-ACP methyl ester carboxylesterase